ncbi:hypothetical protein [Flaviaesturariibacter amylovorans]|uniref:Uncharacterized protein n=1 Tax=Flaviaesturariibacter amylovorans TaxID=1084520 RepID=A0ABP8G447_9BACT
MKPFKLGERLLKELNKKFAPTSMLQLKVAGYDIVVRTDDNGDAVQAFVGKADAHGAIRGDRFARTLKYDRAGTRIKDHWERKGKAS